ncbi:unnamed protein product [Psylliodes chrysocephalus]|uniref:Uncharacterized protein n=1 Tax=Psylliodes chrysocephalus TaxID=3402493 RepID=A0A9P0GD77_9CUCU|nr:unnamed protein product [Psylliodes chrysocephala]
MESVAHEDPVRPMVLESIENLTVTDNNKLDEPNTCYNVNDWINAIFDEQWFPGIIEVINDNKMIISFMVRKENGFNWPMVPDKQVLEPSGILYKLKLPPVPVSNRLFQIPEGDHVDKIFHSIVD